MNQEHNKHSNINRLIIAIETIALIGTIVALMYIAFHHITIN